jgi:hypothetical protein
MMTAPRTARGKDPEGDAGPQTISERLDGLSRRIIRRRRLQQQRFRHRARTFSLRKEAARNLFITGCLLFDVLVVPEPALIFGGLVGLALTGVLLAAVLALEVDFYRVHFSLTPPEEET